jgi:hypothetical protein
MKPYIRMGIAWSLLGASHTLAQDCRWSALGEGTNGRVRAMAAFDQGAGPELFAAGAFTSAGGQPAGRIARWDGAAWHPLPSPLGENVRDLYVHDDGSGPALFVGGDFASFNVIRYNGADFEPVGFGFDAPVHVLLAFDDGSGEALYACGSFRFADGRPASRVARWNGAGWQPLAGGVNDHAYAMAVYDDGSGPALYVAGNFTQAGGQPAARIARWDGSAWSPLGAGLDRTVNALAVHDDGTGPALYAAGRFTAAGGQPAESVARWDGTTWTAVGGGIAPDDNTVNTLAVHDDADGPALYAGGQFTAADGSPASNVAKWDGAAWTPLGEGTDARVVELVVLDTGTGPALYAGGNFTSAGGASANHVARWRCGVTVPGDYATIQQAIDDTPAGERRTVRVAPGVYPGPIDFRGQNVSVRGAGAGQTVLDGASGQTLSVVRFSGGEPDTASLERVTVRGGLTGTPRPDNTTILAGGGVFSYNSAASLRDCVIEDNRASFGGGAYFWNSTGSIERVQFRGNTAFTDAGGLQLNRGTPNVTDCVIEDNFANSRGGGVHLVRVVSTFESTAIRNNRSDNIAGGLSWSPSASAASYLALVGCEITGNTADDQGGIGVQQNGALVQMSLQDTTVCNNLPGPNVVGLWDDLGGNDVCPCTPDLDDNGLLNFFDIAAFALLYQQQDPAADFNADGLFNFFDFSAYLTAFNAGCP